MISKIISQTFSNCLKLLFPYHCYLCKIETTDTSLCNKCISSFTKAIDTPLPFITSIYSFKDERIKKSIHAVKYFHRKDLLPPFTKEISELIKKENYGSCVLVPIPMPVFRKYVRGYNHTEVIAGLISKELTVPVQTNLLYRNKTVARPRQVLTHSRHERLKNQRNAFIASSHAKNRNIILIDDVTTTGATLSEARKVLLGAGASRVTAFTIAH